MRTLSVVLLAAATNLLACGDDTGDTDTDTNTGDDTGEGDTNDDGPDPVWTESSVETAETLTGVYVAGNIVYVTATAGHSWQRSSGTWGILTINIDDEDLNGLWGIGEGADIFLVGVGDAGYIAEYTVAGWTADDVGTHNFESIDGLTEEDLLAVGWGGVYANASGDWEYVNLEGSPRFNHIWYNGAWAAAVGEEGTIGTYSGGTWTITAHESRTALLGVSGNSITDVYAVGEEGLALHWDGNTWTDISPGTSASLWAVYAADATHVFAVGNNGTALMYDGAGTWTELPTGVENNLYAIHGTNATNVWAVGNRGAALNYTGG